MRAGLLRTEKESAWKQLLRRHETLATTVVSVVVIALLVTIIYNLLVLMGSPEERRARCVTCKLFLEQNEEIISEYLDWEQKGAETIPCNQYCAVLPKGKTHWTAELMRNYCTELCYSIGGSKALHASLFKHLFDESIMTCVEASYCRHKFHHHERSGSSWRR